jgi:spore germination protein (amino acid permease)
MSIQLFLGLPRRMCEAGGSAGWMIPLYTSIIALVIFFFIGKLYTPFRSKDIIDIAEIAGGNIMRIVVGLIFIIDYILVLSLLLRIFGEDIKIFALNKSPLSFVVMIFIIVMALAAYCGLEGVSRINFIVVPVVALALFVVLLGNMDYIDTTHIFPILGTGPYKIFVEEMPRISIYSALSCIFFVSPFLGTYTDFKKVGYLSLIIISTLFTLGTLLYILVVPYPVSTEYFIPYLHLARYVSFGRFFERIESIFILMWTLSAFAYLSSGLFLLLYMIKKTFRLEYYRPLILPIATIMYTLCFVPPSLMYAVTLEGSLVRRNAWIVTFLIPLLVLIVARLVKRKKEGEKCDGKI